MSTPSAALVQSVHARLVRHAHTQSLEPNLVFSRFAAERLLFRLAISRHAERFVLKGAFLLLAWLGETIRPTRDVDLLGYGQLSDEALVKLFAEICALEVEPDGMTYDPASVRAAAIRAEDVYGGQRVTLRSHLGKARLSLQIDIGIGDAVSPDPEWLEYPALLGFPRPRLRAYRPETAIAEKIHAMVTLGSKNSRMRDFFDIHALAAHESFSGNRLAGALATTFRHRGTAIPTELPLALTPAFAAIEGKSAQWEGFLSRSRLKGRSASLPEVIEAVAAFIGPVLGSLARQQPSAAKWPPGGPWVQDAAS